MPFGITGGPSEFGFVVGQRMHDLIADGMCENFVDDGGSAANSFKEGMAKLHRILERIRREKLSLSLGKFQVFMTEAVFAGARDFKKGQLVQVYQNKVASTLSTEHKLAPMWSPPRRITERLLDFYKLEMLEGTTLDGLFHARRLWDFIPREGTTLAIAQKKLEEALASGELEKSDIVAPKGGMQEELDYEKAGNREWGNSALEGSEEEDPGGEEGEGNAGFLYEDEGDRVPEEEESGIGARVAARRRGRLHNGGGQME
ncbi:hypothetical protein K443DRAFT_10492 [Laccaria amethystina LaAM-08-1]|uniref:Reverse transcriptase domain-containing protein n=1 Tax=Laccaria amethystina LaAM-08-1 TaxID=1095629 RepID=A0A0C9X5R0_9AGAR|nr:hypothetical protein K443DRAFT_10492 [Laccaria amethystina LaAM-08-1]